MTRRRDRGRQLSESRWGGSFKAANAGQHLLWKLTLHRQVLRNSSAVTWQGFKSHPVAEQAALIGIASVRLELTESTDHDLSAYQSAAHWQGFARKYLGFLQRFTKPIGHFAVALPR